jgi:hypothetical protein
MEGEELSELEKVGVCIVKRHEPREPWTPTVGWNGESKGQCDVSLSIVQVGEPVGHVVTCLHFGQCWKPLLHRSP